MKTCIIMRGVSGAGKSSWLAKNFPKAVICCADDYHMVNGVYTFDPLKAGEAHKKCMQKFLAETAIRGFVLVAVANTNVTANEIAPYYRVAEASGYEVEIVWLHCEPLVAAARTTHGTPVETVKRMAVSFEPLRPDWNVRHVFAG